MHKRLLICISVAAAFILLLGSCSVRRPSHAGPSAPAASTHPVVPPTRHMDSWQKALVREAREWLGTPYVYGRDVKGSGTDCSGLVMQVYKVALDISLPRNSARQAEFCTRIKPKHVEAGDLVFFATGSDPKRVSHVGIMLDDGDSFIHASSSKGVTVSRLSNPWYASRLLMYGRVPGLQHAITDSEAAEDNDVPMGSVF